MLVVHPKHYNRLYLVLDVATVSITTLLLVFIPTQLENETFHNIQATCERLRVPFEDFYA